RAIEKVGGQADDAFDEAALDEVPADVGFLVAAEEHAVRQNDRALAFALERRGQVQQESIVTVFSGRNAVLETLELVVGRVETAGPGLRGKRRIGDSEIEGLETVVLVLEVWG